VEEKAEVEATEAAEEETEEAAAVAAKAAAAAGTGAALETPKRQSCQHNCERW
jgi:hypothetical protein